MGIEEYCGNTIELSAMKLVFTLTNETREKISKKELIYKEQIVRFIKKKIDFYFNSLQIKKALLHAYKNEIYNSVMFKLQPIFKEFNIFQCI
ncbi:hypothetical protein [Bacillus marasmi]|uniref:hypothetical protein n=1 Tax=Bacillus marasmi TaxID=1926279 RepID=UPI0011CAAE70|nr:hypothetical protein [Bacillus marasmi]